MALLLWPTAPCRRQAAGERHEPTFSECLLGGTGSWPEGAGYAAWQKAKLPRMRLGVLDGTPLADEIDRLLKEETGL